ncbi:MAG: pacearchaeosortase [Nanoarchaeota archaeon]|nr:pacearchaeosortase [Nanoarchaeota archaeon]
MNTKKRIKEQPKYSLGGLLARYGLIILLGLGNLFVFYNIFTPLTSEFVYFILRLFSDATRIGDLIVYNSILVRLIPACIAGSAYYLLFILIFSTPNIIWIKRIRIVLFSFGLLFLLNSLRIVFLIIINQSVYFEYIHLFFWYFLSTIFVIGIWIITIKIFKIQDIPLYTDIRDLRELITKIKTKN